MVCFAEDNKIISGIDNTITNRTEKTRIFNTPLLSGVVDRATTNCLPLHHIYIYAWFVHRVVSLVNKFSEKTSELS